MGVTTDHLSLYMPGGGSLGIGGEDETADIDRLNQNSQKIDNWAETVDDRIADLGAVGLLTITDAQRLALVPPQLREGLQVNTSDTRKSYIYTNSKWEDLTHIPHRISMRRSATPVQIASNKYDNLSTSAYWAEASRNRFDAYADGIVIPATGVYRVGYRLRSSGAILAGLTVNTPTVGTLDAMLLQASSGAGVGGNFLLSVTGQLSLNQGDLVRLFALGAAVTPWSTNAAGSAFEAELIP